MKVYLTILFARRTEQNKKGVVVVVVAGDNKISMYDQFNKYNSNSVLKQQETSYNNHPVVSMSITVGSVEEDLVTSSRS